MTSPQPTVTGHASDAAGAYVMVIVGDRATRAALERNRPTVIGRAEECDLRIDDASVSRRHARLELDADGGTLEDLGSHNGTLLNDQPITGARRVSSGDVVTIGKAALILYLVRARPVSRGRPSADILERLEAEVDRALRYQRMLSVMVWDSSAPPASLMALFAGLLRRCDSMGVTSGGSLVGVFPELDGEQADEVARRAVDLLRAASPDVRGGIAVFPGDGADAATLVSGARDALASAEGGVGRAEQAVRRLPVGDRVVLVADPGMVRAFDLLRRLAAADLAVLVTGETGVGKEIAARAVHAWSRRAAGPFVAVNCAALPESLVESELFGHRRGAFSGADRDKAGFFESAHGGTLFLDEIGELPLAAQAKLLRAVDTRQVTRVGSTESISVDLRLVAATNRDLAADVAAERFRADLFYRLSAAVVVLPPLRDRPRELAPLARTFLDGARARLGRPPIGISLAAMRRLQERRFAGNIRELANAMEYAAAIIDDEVLEPWHLPAEPSTVSAAGPPQGQHAPPVSFRPIAEEIEELERRRMQEALKACGGNQSQAADLISMPRRTFVTKLGKYGLR